MSNPFIYAIKEDGTLLWYEHLGAAAGTFAWNGAKEVGTGWNAFKKVFSGGKGVIYAINEADELIWYRHLGFVDGSNRWEGPHTVAQGWDYGHVFAGDNGVIYGIEKFKIDVRTGQRTGGHLIWQRHLGMSDGTDHWSERKKVGNSWHTFHQVFWGGAGIVYAIKENGDLFWYLHQGHETGTFSWLPEKKVGVGWNFDHGCSGGEGIIYAVQPFKIDPRTGQRSGANLQWYRHLGYADGSFTWAEEKQVGKSWRNMLYVFSGGSSAALQVVPGTERQCGVPDHVGGGIQILTYGSPGGRWSRGNLTYSVNATGSNVTQNFANSVMAAAFSQWSNAAPYFTFTQTGGPADIQVQFGGTTLNEKFDKVGGTLAVGYYPENGGLHFDANEDWTPPNKLLSVALHEVGHVLGLTHSNSRTSLMYPYDLSLVTLDGETISAIQNLYGWRSQVQLFDRGSSEGPSLAVAGGASLGGSGLGALFKVWKGTDGDSAVYWSALNGDNWTAQQRIEGIGSAHGPALATGFTTNGVDGVPVTGLFMAWDGAPGESKIYFSQSKNLSSWSNQLRVEGVGTSDRPALCMFRGVMYMAWTGIAGDSKLYWSAFNGTEWSEQRSIRGRGSSDGPTITVLGNRLYMFWKGISGDSNVYYSWIDNQSAAIWQPQQPVQYTDAQADGNINLNIGTSKRLIASTRGNAIILAWKGISNDAGIYFSSFENNEFSGQVRIEGVGTSAGPGLTVINNRICMVWKGVEGDSNLYSSWLG